MTEFQCLPCLRKVKEGTSAATGVKNSAASTTSTDSSARDTSMAPPPSTPQHVPKVRRRQPGVAQAIPQPWHNNEPFHLVKLTRKTHICRGCGGGYLYKTTKFAIRHKENNPWFDTRVGAKRASFGNTHYHATTALSTDTPTSKCNMYSSM